MSQDRERALLEVLSPRPGVLDRAAIEPDQAMVLPQRTLTPAPGPGPAWLDEPHPQLNGLTPREACEYNELVLAVELLLRIAEPDSNRRGDPIDLFGLREELDLLE